MNVRKISSIIKNNKVSTNDINNTRSLTLSNALSNLFERYLKIQIEKKIVIDDKQFGFKRNSSTRHSILRSEFICNRAAYATILTFCDKL